MWISSLLRVAVPLPSPLLTVTEPRRITLIGGSVRAAAQDAKRAGYQIIAVDRFGDRDLLDVCERWIYYDADHQWINRLSDYPRVPIVAVGGFERPVPLAEDLGFEDLDLYMALEQRLVAYPSKPVLAAIHFPARLGKIAYACDVLFPETKSIDGHADEWNYSPPCPSPVRKDTNRSSDWLLKPVDHSGGYGIRLANPGEANHKPRHYLQRKANGFPIGVNFLAWNEPIGMQVRLLGAFRGITFRRCPEHPFLYGGSLGPISLSVYAVQRLSQLGEKIAHEFSLKGLFNLDLMMASDGTLSLLEVNPRYSASMELMACHETVATEVRLIRPSLIDWHLRANDQTVGLGIEVDRWLQSRSEATQGGSHCKRIVYNDPTSPAISWSRFNDNLRRITESSGDQASIQISDIPVNAAAIVPGAPLCTVVVTNAPTLSDALRTSRKIARQIKNG